MNETNASAAPVPTSTGRRRHAARRRAARVARRHAGAARCHARPCAGLDRHRRPQRRRQIDAAARAGRPGAADRGPGVAAGPALARVERARAGPAHRLAGAARPGGRRAEPARGGARWAGCRTWACSARRVPRTSGRWSRRMHDTECSAWAQRRLQQLSGGERQRGLLARALAVNAPVLLLDEPTTHLDPPHQVAVVRLLQRLAATRTVVSVLHDLPLALQADRVVVMREGRVLADGRARRPGAACRPVRGFRSGDAHPAHRRAFHRLAEPRLSAAATACAAAQRARQAQVSRLWYLTRRHREKEAPPWPVCWIA